MQNMLQNMWHLLETVGFIESPGHLAKYREYGGIMTASTSNIHGSTL